MTEHPLRALARTWREKAASDCDNDCGKEHTCGDRLYCADKLDAALDALPAQGADTDVASAEPGESGDATPERNRTQPPLPVGATRSGAAHDLIARLRAHCVKYRSDIDAVNTADLLAEAADALERANKRLAALEKRLAEEREWYNAHKDDVGEDERVGAIWVLDSIDAVLGEESKDNG